MPVTTTQLIMLDDFVGRKAWETEEKVAQIFFLKALEVKRLASENSSKLQVNAKVLYPFLVKGTKVEII